MPKSKKNKHPKPSSHTKNSNIGWTRVPDPELVAISNKVKQARKDEDAAYKRRRLAASESEHEAAETHLREVKARVARLTQLKKPHRNRVMEEIGKGWWEGYVWSGPGRGL
jgi:hypothetical protein